jgi:hypothetical protein
MGKKRKKVSTSLNSDLLKKIKHIAIDEGKDYNDLLEEGMRKVIRSRKRKKETKLIKETKDGYYD